MNNRNQNRDAFTLILVLVALACTVFSSRVIADNGTPKPFWNRYSVQFMYAPAFEFPTVAGAVRYRFVVTDDVLLDHIFESDKPTDRLSPVWDGLPVGYAKLAVYGLDAQGRICGISGERRFWRSAPFVPDVPWSYGEAATRYYGWLFEQPNTVSFREKGVPNGGKFDLLEIYPSKMNSSLICAMVHYAKRGVGWVRSSGEAGQYPWMRRNSSENETHRTRERKPIGRDAFYRRGIRAGRRKAQARAVSCVFRRARDTTVRADNGVYVKSGAGRKGGETVSAARPQVMT